MGDFLTRNCALFSHLITPFANSVKFEDSFGLSGAVSEKAFGLGRKHETSQRLLEERAK
jgi:hypothetical protein